MAIGIAFSVMVRFGNDNPKGKWKSTVLIFNAFMSIRMPVLLGLTIRSAKKKKPAPKIPSRPMFHDDDDDDSNMDPEDESVNFQEENNGNVNAISVISGRVIQETSF